MLTRTLLPLILTALLAAHAPAQNDETPAKPKATGKKTREKTPALLIAAYTLKVKAALGARWAAELTPRMGDFATGSVSVAFKLNADGKVAEFEVTANTSNAPFAKFCEQFVRGTKFEKPPGSVLAEGLLEIPFTFSIL